MALPWPTVLAEMGDQIANAASSQSLQRAAPNHGGDDFRTHLWEEGFVCDALDTMNQWYFAIVIKTDRAQNSVRIHYDGWPGKYDEWIDVDSHRLQPFQTRARMNQRPCETRPHPGHAIQSINLDSLVRDTGAKPSPSTAQFMPSASNSSGDVTGMQDIRQLSFDLSSCIATMGEGAAAATTAAGDAATAGYSAQLHAFSLKLQKAIASEVESTVSRSTGNVSAYVLTDRHLGMVSPLTSATVLPTAITVAHPGGQVTGAAAITTAVQANKLPPPSHFISQSCSSLSAISPMSFKNHAFLTEISRAYRTQHERNMKNARDNFVVGFNSDLLKQLPDDVAPPSAFPLSMRAMPPASSLPMCAYVLGLLQQHLSRFTMQQLPAVRVINPSQPRGSVAEQNFLVVVNPKEAEYFSEVRAFLTRFLRAGSLGDGEQVAQLKQAALGTFVQLTCAMGRQDGVLAAAGILLDFFHSEFDESTPAQATNSPRRALLLSLCELVQAWSRCTTISAYRMLGSQREEVRSGLSEARSPSLANASVSSPAQKAVSVSSPSADPSGITPLTSVTNPPPASLVNLASFHAQPLPDVARVVMDPSGAWLWTLTSDFGLCLLAQNATGEGGAGSAAGTVVKQNAAFALHAPFAHLTFVPSPTNGGRGYSGPGTLLLRSQLCPGRLLCVDPTTLELTGAEIPLTDEVTTDDDASFAWELSYAPSSAPTAGGYDPARLPPIVLPPSWRSDVTTVGFICDVMDRGGDWYPAMVVSVNESMLDPASATVTVQFDGWASNQNERILVASNRLAPFATRINLLQRFSKSTQQGDHLLDLSAVIRNVQRATGVIVFSPPNLNTPAFAASLKEGSIVDARDSAEMWFAAEVAKVEGDLITVRYDGWGAKYNETLPRSSPRLAPFCTQTSLAMRLKDPQQDVRHALSLDQAIAEVRGRADLQLAQDEQLSVAFRRRFEQIVLRSSSWGLGTELPLAEDNPNVFLRLDPEGMVLVNSERATRKRCFLGLVIEAGQVMTPEEEAAAAVASSIADASSMSAVEPARPVARAASSSKTAVAPAVTLLSSSRARRIRSVVDAGLPLFVHDHSALAADVDLLMVRVQEDGVHYRVATYTLPKILGRSTAALGSPLRSVDLQDTLPMQSVHSPAREPLPPKTVNADTRDADQCCRNCGTFLTSPLPSNSAAIRPAPSAVQLSSPGARRFFKCAARECEKAKLLLCTTCQTFNSFPLPHQADHQIESCENIVENEQVALLEAAPAPITLSTKPHPILALFDPRDESIIMSALPSAPTPTIGIGTITNSSRTFDFRGFSLRDGRLLAAPTPQSSAATFFLHASLCDYSVYARGCHPNAGSAMCYRLCRSGSVGRSAWMHKSPRNNRRLHPDGLLFRLPDADSADSNLDLLAGVVAQLLASIPVVEDSEHCMLHFGNATDVLLRVGALYTRAAARSQAGPHTAVRHLLVSAMRLVVAYLASLTSVWPLVRRENPIHGRDAADRLHQHRMDLKTFIVGLVMPLIGDNSNHAAASGDEAVQALLAHMLSSAFGFFFVTWLERLTFLRSLIEALPSSRDVGASDEGSFAFLLLRHFLSSYFQSNWLGNPAGHSSAASNENIFVDLEICSTDLGVAAMDEGEEAAAQKGSPSSPFPQQPLPSSASLFGDESRSAITFFLQVMWPCDDTVSSPSIPQRVASYVLLALQFHLARQVVSAGHASPPIAQTTGPNDDLLRVPIDQLQYSQARPCSDLLVYVISELLGRLSELLLAHRSPATPLRIHPVYHQIFSFAAFVLGAAELKLASSERLVALLPCLFWSTYELERKYLPKHAPEDPTNVLSLTRQGSTKIAPVPALLPPTYQLQFVDASSHASVAAASVGESQAVRGFSGLLKTALAALLKVVYSAVDLTPTMTAGADSTEEDAATKLLQLTELSHMSSTPLSATQHAFLERFLSVNPSEVATIGAGQSEPELLLNQLIRLCLLEMGGGASNMALEFAWPMERAAAATLLRFMHVASESSATSNPANQALSPRKEATPAPGTTASSQPLLLDCCFHFAHALDIHLLISKSQQHGRRLLLQPELPAWFKQLIYLLFEHVRTPLLERMRAQVPEERLATPSPPPAKQVEKAEAKDQEEKSDEAKDEAKQSGPVQLAGTPSPSPDEANDKLQPNVATRLHVARLLGNATFLLFHFSAGSSRPAWGDLPSVSRFTSPRCMSKSPLVSPLPPALALGDAHVVLAPIPLDRFSSSMSMRARSNSITYGAPPEADEDSDEDDDDEVRDSSAPPPSAPILIRSLSDRMPSSSTFSVASSPPALGPGLWAQSPPVEAASFLAPPSTSTAAHSQALRRTRRSNLLGSAAWIIGLMSTVTPQDQAHITAFRARTQNSHRLGQARVEMLRLINSQMFRGDADEGQSDDQDALPAIPIITLEQLRAPNLVFDQVLPMVWSTLEHTPPAPTPATSTAPSSSSSNAANHRVHLLYPSVSLCDLNEKAYARQVRDAANGCGEDHATLLIFLRGLVAWLDASVLAMDGPAAADLCASPLHHQRLRLVFHFLSQEFHGTARDKATLLASGALGALVRFAFHPRISSDMSELARVSWTVFSFLIASVLSRGGVAGDATHGHLGKNGSSVDLHVALKPLHSAILENLSHISQRIPNFNPLLLLPPAEMVAQKTRYVPPPLALDSLAVDQLVDAKDKAGSWFPSRIVKLESKLGGVEAWIQFSGWAEASNEWIPVRSGKLASLFTHVDIDAYNQNGRPNKYRLDLNAAIALHKSRQGQPLSDAVKTQAKTNLAEIQAQVNEKIVLSINMIRIMCSTSALAPSPSTLSSGVSSSMSILSSFLRLLSASASGTQRPLPIILQVELLQYLKKTLPRARFTPADFNNAAALTVGTDDAVLDAEQVIRCLLTVLGSSIWTARASRAQPSVEAVLNSFLPDATSSIAPALDSEAWLYQNWWDTTLAVTEGARKLQEYSAQFLFDSILHTPADSKQGTHSWSQLLVATMEASLSSLPTMVSHLASNASAPVAPATSSSLLELQPSDVLPATADLGLEDAPFYLSMASLKLLSGFESFLRNGSRVSVRLNDETENVDLDSHDTLIANMAPHTTAGADASPPHATNAFDFSSILHGYVSSFASGTLYSNSSNPAMLLELLRELDADQHALGTPGANQTNLNNIGNSQHNEELLAGTAGGVIQKKYTMVPATLSLVRPLPSRKIQLSRFVDAATCERLKSVVVAIVRAAGPAPAASATVNLLGLTLRQIQYEALRGLASQLSNGSWLMKGDELASLLRGLVSSVPRNVYEDLTALTSDARSLPRTDVAFQALALLQSRSCLLERDYLTRSGSQRLRLPSSLASVADVSTVAETASAEPEEEEEADIAQPGILTAIDSVESMGYSLAQARAAILAVGSLDFHSAVELILTNHRSTQRIVTAEEWAAFLDTQGIRLTVEKYLKQQAKKKAAMAASAPASASADIAPVATHWTCLSCTVENQASALLCEMCSALRPPMPASSAVDSAGASSVASVAPPAPARRPLNAQSEQLHLGPSSGSSERELLGSPVTRLPMTKVATFLPSLVGLSVHVKTPSPNIVPHTTLQAGIIIKVVPVPASSSSSSPASIESAAVRGLVLVRFPGTLSSTRPAPSCFAWLSLSDLTLDPLSPFEVSRTATVLSLTHSREQLELRAQNCLDASLEQLAKIMLATLARKEMRAVRLSIAPSLSNFTLPQLLSSVSLFTHPVDSLPTMLKSGSKNREKLVEDTVAYLLRNNSSDRVDAGKFDVLLNQAREVLNSVDLTLRTEVQLPSEMREPLRLVPTPGVSSAPASSSSIPGLVSVMIRTDAWLTASNSSNTMSFYSDPLHLHLLKQITFPATDDKDSSKRTPPAPFVLPAPLFITLHDLEHKNVLAKVRVHGMESALSDLLHVTPWTIDGLKTASTLIDIAVYLLSQAAALNGFRLSSEQRCTVHNELLYPVFQRLMAFVLEQLAPLGFFPSNLALSSVKLMSRVLTVWSGVHVDQLPLPVRQALEGQLGDMPLMRSMATNKAACSEAVRSAGTPWGSIAGVSQAPLFDCLLALDVILCAQLLQRFAVDVSTSHAGRQPFYLTSVMECMAALRLLVAEHSPRLVSPPAEERFRAPTASKFDALFRGAHVQAVDLQSQVQTESLSERRETLAGRQRDLDAWPGKREGLMFELAVSARDKASKALRVYEQAVELKLVLNMVTMLRRAQGKTARRPLPLPPSERQDGGVTLVPSLGASGSAFSAVVAAAAELADPDDEQDENEDDEDEDEADDDEGSEVSASISSRPLARASRDDGDLFAAASASPPAVDEAAERRAAFNSRTLLHFDLSSFSVFGSLLFPRMEGNRWMGLYDADAVAGGAAGSSAQPAASPSSPQLSRTESNKSEMGELVPSLRSPLCSLLLPAQAARLQLFHDVLLSTRVRDRHTPDFAFDTSMRWEDELAAGKPKKKVDATAIAAAAKTGSSRRAEKLSLFEQLCGQLGATAASNLRGPIGEYSWKTSFVGAADEGAQGFVGMFKQVFSHMAIQLAQAAFRPTSLSESLLIPCPNGLSEVGSNRNKLLINPNLLAVKDLKRFFAFGQLLGCALRSSTCLPLDMSRLFWKLLLHGVEGILAGDASQAFERGLAELRQVDWNAAAMLTYVAQLESEEEFDALELTYSTSLSGGIVTVDLFPGGSHVPVAFADRLKYARLVLYHRLNESCCALQAIRFGLRSVVPSTCPTFSSSLLLGGDHLSEFLPSPSALHLLTHEELELLVCGAREVDLVLLRQHTIYKNCTESSAIVQNFWTVLNEFNSEDRSRFLQFSFGRSRLPANFTDMQQHMTLNVMELPPAWRARYSGVGSVAASSSSSIPAGPAEAAATIEDANSLRLPKSQTCFFIVDLPNYPNLAILRHKLTMALGCTDINF